MVDWMFTLTRGFIRSVVREGAENKRKKHGPDAKKNYKKSSCLYNDCVSFSRKYFRLIIATLDYPLVILVTSALIIDN